MSSLSLVIVLLMFTLSSHACTARPLTTKSTANKCHFQQAFHVYTQIVYSHNFLSCDDNNNSDGGWYAGASFQMDSPSSLATKEERRHAETRSLLGPANYHHAHQETEEEEEAIVQMDYAQPHRKPPIHNNKP
ncbi:hypothetical protein PIB30_008570 [Stylosanthes scabra]|uniref:Uncharacterized protein n=1 Tax=Stylosanthes scabra TaxID=79078 RepID=A0ABU6Q4Z2_9FABA|nr:hypothetical protein [Stylosanthes scabra]